MLQSAVTVLASAPVDTVTNVISTVGFPIACCLGLGWYINKRDKAHAEETDNLRKALENNTKVMLKICGKLGIDEED